MTRDQSEERCRAICQAYAEGMTIREIVRAFGSHQGTVQMILWRAGLLRTAIQTRRLRKALREEVR